MNDVEELKAYAGVHARGQRIAGYADVLARIGSDGEGPGSWVFEWSAEAERLRGEGRLLDACRRLVMARFPYVDGPGRKEAQRDLVDTFTQWSAGTPIEPLTVDLGGTPVRCWQSGLAPGGRRPLLVVMGGIVSVKEQWAPALPVFTRLGMAAVAVDMPGTGENPLAYDRHAWRMLPWLFNALADRADVDRSYALTLSFSGHLALRCAADDPRLRGIVTAGAPVRAFFTDPIWRRSVPAVTLDTLAHLIRVEADETGQRLPDLALTDGQLAAVRVPVRYIASRRDEIIPAQDVDLLRERVPNLQVLEHDDVHGSPRHVTESQMWCALSLLRMRRVRDLRRAVLGLLWRVARARGV
jgi:pimeloyl-ACP methyl ester carboxylesterase